MSEFLERLLERTLDGPTLLVALICLLLCGAVLRWTFTPKPDRKKVLKVAPVLVLLVCLAGMIMVVIKGKSNFEKVFPDNQASILVLGIIGDEKNDLQRHLVASLHQELKQTRLTNIIVRASDDEVDDSRIGLSAAHEKARSCGRQHNAKIVVWGSRIGERIFHPRITLAIGTNYSTLREERELMVQQIDEIQLPAQLLNEPVFLASFIIGLSAYENDDFAQAIRFFETALKCAKPGSSEHRDLEFFTAYSRVFLADSQLNPKEQLILAIQGFRSASSDLAKSESPSKWAHAQNHLGVTLVKLARLSSNADRDPLLLEGAAAFRSAIPIFEGQLPDQWAMAQNNLGMALSQLAYVRQGKEASNLDQQAISAFRASLTVWSLAHFPERRAQAQDNLGISLRQIARALPAGEQLRLGAEAISLGRNALTLCSRDKFPELWASIHNNLGVACYERAELLGGTNALELLAEATIALNAALKVRTRDRAPYEWAATLHNLSNVLRARAVLTEDDNAIKFLNEAIHGYRAALEVRTHDKWPLGWAMTQCSMANAQVELARHTPLPEKVQLIRSGIEAYQAGLTIRTRHELPFLWGATLNDMAGAYLYWAETTTGDAKMRLYEKARDIYRGALEVFTEAEYPTGHAAVMKNLTHVEYVLRLNFD